MKVEFFFRLSIYSAALHTILIMLNYISLLNTWVVNSILDRPHNICPLKDESQALNLKNVGNIGNERQYILVITDSVTITLNNDLYCQPRKSKNSASSFCYTRPDRALTNLSITCVFGFRKYMEYDATSSCTSYAHFG